ncbi:MAG: putative rane protein [Gemmatimonadetes bacterium]|jgi:uncharacterized protein (DUF983 family)|nr:putative rane protein [Gemmatimonadota bacterium]
MASRVHNPGPAAPGTPRTTDSPLDMPSTGLALRILVRVLRLRCPHCGGGHVLNRRAGVNDRCAECNFRFERSEENYFMGAMFFNFMMGTSLFVAALLAIIAFSGPTIPWDMLQYVLPILLAVCMVVLYPVSKVVWLAVDVMLRPVTAPELV